MRTVSALLLSILALAGATLAAPAPNPVAVAAPVNPPDSDQCIRVCTTEGCTIYCEKQDLIFQRPRRLTMFVYRR